MQAKCFRILGVILQAMLAVIVIVLQLVLLLGGKSAAPERPPVRRSPGQRIDPRARTQ